MDNSIKKALEHRKIIKGKKPDFVKQDSHKKPKLSSSYRKPRGLQSKMRLNKKGYRGTPSCGYGSPNLVKNLTKEGLLPFVVSNLSDLDKIDVKKECIIISSRIGTKKRIELVKLAIDKKIVISGVKDSKIYLSSLEESIKVKKDAAKKKVSERSSKREKSSKEASKKNSKKESVEDKVSQEDKKKLEKEEKDKILQKKQ
jgi:large subunit ribosomal protein L32e